MRPALLLIDLQRDFLDQRGLFPKSAAVVARTAVLLDHFRTAGLPVIHIHTQVRTDGSDRMPHWKREDTWLCVEGTPGVEAPPALAPVSGEKMVAKQFFSGFGTGELQALLRESRIDTLVLAGVHLHGCVRATAFEAYERGYEVWVADEAVASREPDHAEMTRVYLEGRVASFLSTAEILRRVHGGTAEVSLVGECPVTKACAAVSQAQQDWGRLDSAARFNVLLKWAEVLSARSEMFAKLLVDEIGKPIRDSRDEVRRAIELIRTAVEVFSREMPDSDAAFRTEFCPYGVVGLITPWNNPIAIAVGKIAPALAGGNGVVWKPALEAARTNNALLNSLAEAGLPDGAVQLVVGGAAVARQIISDPRVAAVSLTGSVETGRAAAALCTRLGKPLQAELGGNNPAIVLQDFDFRKHARALALASFSFAGQRCTRIQRYIVERSIAADFQQTLVAAVQSLNVGDPLREETDIGPMVSKAETDRVKILLNDAISAGAELLCGGTAPADWADDGRWLSPALLAVTDPQARIAQEEIFGPIALIIPADDLIQAIRLANGVEYGLVAALHSNDPDRQKQFLETIEAGIVQLAPGPVPIHARAPFGGWKTSRLGPPEHGAWDRDFYLQPRAVYGAPSA